MNLSRSGGPPKSHPWYARCSPVLFTQLLFTQLQRTPRLDVSLFQTRQRSTRHHLELRPPGALKSTLVHGLRSRTGARQATPHSLVDPMLSWSTSFSGKQFFTSPWSLSKVVALPSSVDES